MSKQNVPLIWYRSEKNDNSDTYSNNISESRSENFSDYGSDYESDTKISTIKPQISQSPKVEEQDYLLPNYETKEEISLFDTYKREDLTNLLVIQVERDEYKKFSVINDISEVYGEPGIHELEAFVMANIPLEKVDKLQKWLCENCCEGGFIPKRSFSAYKRF
ncbi:hypothetical protein Glove_38g15 [Diversispora epigaea]|uniref:Uncharacterized protein n=1 Tax=Diversispora epigaea TaxID=1348612 RepID=A0A397JKB0_9GLOM|nr:hypothetical protein Glove_38g15 [Diversispora epigaea]